MSYTCFTMSSFNYSNNNPSNDAAASVTVTASAYSVSTKNGIPQQCIQTRMYIEKRNLSAYNKDGSMYSIESQHKPGAPIREHKASFITRQVLMRATTLPQLEASKQLGVSTSTLKRKCREYKLDWPKNHKERLIRKCHYMMNIGSIITWSRQDEQDTKYLSQDTLTALKAAFNSK